jgi:hypothetical protein
MDKTNMNNADKASKRDLMSRAACRLVDWDGDVEDIARSRAGVDADARSRAFAEALAAALAAWDGPAGTTIGAEHWAELESYVCWAREHCDVEDDLEMAIEAMLADLPRGQETRDAEADRPSLVAPRRLIAEGRAQWGLGLDTVVSVAISGALASEDLAEIGISPVGPAGHVIRRAHVSAMRGVGALVDDLRRRAVLVLDGYDAALDRISELEAELARTRVRPSGAVGTRLVRRAK